VVKPGVGVQKTISCKSNGARQSTLFKRSSSLLKTCFTAPAEHNLDEQVVIPDVSPLHHKPAPNLPVETLRALGTKFSGISPEEVADDQLLRFTVLNEDMD
jgi:hypothetical protein